MTLQLENSEIITKDSGRSGPHLVIIGGVHGDEHCGVRAIEDLAPTFQPDKGEVTFIIANKKALAQDVRFVESNLNRAFNTDQPKTLEERTAAQLKPLLDEADALLDLHASNTEGSEPFAICDDRSVDAAKSLPVLRIVTGLQEGHPGSTDEYVNRQGKTGVCVECGYTKDLEGTTAVAKQAIKEFCTSQGILEGQTTRRDVPVLKADKHYKNKHDTFKPAKEFKDFQKLKKGELIGHDGDEEVRAAEDSRILFVRETQEKGKECFLIARRHEKHI